MAGVGLALLAALLDKSMLGARADGRLALHPLLLHHAGGQPALRADAAALRDSHSRWTLALAGQTRADLAAEHDHLLAAWKRAVERKDAAAVESVLFTLPWSAMVRGHLDEATALLGGARRWLRALRALAGVQEPVRREAAAFVLLQPGRWNANGDRRALPATLQALLAEIVVAG